MRLRSLNYVLTLVLVVILFLIVEFSISSGTELSGGNYGRYLDSLWAREILRTGVIETNPFPTNPSLFSNANGYRFNLVPAVTLLELNLVAGLDLLVSQRLPIYGVSFILSALILASALYDKRPGPIILGLGLSCFFVYTLNEDAREIHRIVLSFTLLNMFLYAFVMNRKRYSISFKVLELIFVLGAVLAYSSIAVGAIVFVGLLALVDTHRTRRVSSSSLGILYAAACLLYYLILTGFLEGGIVAVKQVFDARGFNFQFWLFTKPGIWPTQLEYAPAYSTVDWFFLLYPFAVLSALVLVAIVLRLRRWRLTKRLDLYDELLIAFSGFLVFIIVFNSYALFPTAGLDYIAIFGWLAPPLCVYPFVEMWARFAERDFELSQTSERTLQPDGNPCPFEVKRMYPSLFSRRGVAVAAIGIMILLGTFGIFHYSTLEPRAAERVTPQEVAAAEWLVGKGFVVSSDLHFVSTYVTLGGASARHFIPVGSDLSTIEAIYYNANVSFLQMNGANAFVVTRNMEIYYITHFVGTRTLPNPKLSSEFGAQWSEVYDNGNQRVFCGC